MIPRQIEQYLKEWKQRPNRKPLILRGARQVGKTTLGQNFGSNFDHFLYFNLEISSERQLFETIDDIDILIQALYLQRGIARDTNREDLIFIDEIQESNKAIQKLRYFHENHPDLFVIGAGSLLEHGLGKIQNFPVGRVEYAILHPMNFREFLTALAEDQVLQQLDKIPIQEFAHRRLLELFHKYAVIGGMPEIVDNYSQTHDISVLKIIYNSLIQSYKDDVEKYARNESEAWILRHIIDTAAFKVDERVTFAGFGNSSYRSRDVGRAMRSLEKARLIQLIYPTVQVAPPPTPKHNRKPRLQFLDTGLLNNALGIQPDLLGISDLNDIHRGKIIQHLVIQEYMSVHNVTLFKPVFWVRETSTASAEVDLIHPINQYLIPIEIKSGSEGRLRSLHEFMERCEHHYAVRLLGNKFLVHDAKTASGKKYKLMNLPYYLGTKIPEYVAWFVNNY